MVLMYVVSMNEITDELKFCMLRLIYKIYLCHIKYMYGHLYSLYNLYTSKFIDFQSMPPVYPHTCHGEGNCVLSIGLL